MMKLVLVAALAAVIGVPEAAAQSVVQRTDWQDRKFETYLPPVTTTVPWLEIDTKTKLPKGDIPVGRDVASIGPFVLPHSTTDVQVSDSLLRFAAARSSFSCSKADRIRSAYGAEAEMARSLRNRTATL